MFLCENYRCAARRPRRNICAGGMHGENLRDLARGGRAGAMRWFPTSQVDNMRIEVRHEIQMYCLFSDIDDVSMAPNPKAFPN